MDKMNCHAFSCFCYYCSRVQYGCKRNTPEKCNNCHLDVICSQPPLPECLGEYPNCCYLPSECNLKEYCKQKANK